MPTAKIRNDAPTSKVRNDSPTAKVRVSSFRTGSNTLTQGSPIGLLLALTYASTQTVNYVSGEAPQFIRIRND